MEQSNKQKGGESKLKVTHRAQEKPTKKPRNQLEESIYYKAQVDALYNVIKIMSGK